MKVSTKPTTAVFTLQFDPEGQSTVTIRQATTGDNILLADLFNEQSRVWSAEDTIELKQRWNFEVVKRKRAYLTLAGADIEDEDGNPVFKFGDGKNGPRVTMPEADFNRAWGLLPQELTDEIHTYILMVNPQWNPALQGE